MIDTVLVNIGFFTMNWYFPSQDLKIQNFFSSFGGDCYFIEKRTGLGIGLSYELLFGRFYYEYLNKSYSPYLLRKIFYKELKTDNINTFLMPVFYLRFPQTTRRKFNFTNYEYGIRLLLGSMYSIEISKNDIKDFTNFMIGTDVSISKLFKLYKKSHFPEDIYQADKKLREIEENFILVDSRIPEIEEFKFKVYDFHNRIRRRILDRDATSFLLAVCPYSILGAGAGLYIAKNTITMDTTETEPGCDNALVGIFLYSMYIIFDLMVRTGMVIGCTAAGTVIGTATGYLTGQNYYNYKLTETEKKELVIILNKYYRLINESINK